MSYEEQVLEHLAKTFPGLPNDITIYLKRALTNDGTYKLVVSLVDQICKREACFPIQEKLEDNEQPAEEGLRAIANYRLGLFTSVLKAIGVDPVDYVSINKDLK